MKRRTRTLILTAAACMLMACGTAEKPKQAAKAAAKSAAKGKAQHEAQDARDKAPAEPEAAQVDAKVQRAVAVAKAIGQDPDNADAILQKHGLNRDELDLIMFEIASDADLASAYRLALAEDPP